VVTALCERVGLEAADLDVDELTDGVHGYAVARQISVRGALELLAVAYHFDAVESDYKLRFRKRGRASARTISESELMALNERGERYIETRAQDVDLPMRFTVRYNDTARDGDIGTQTIKRIAAPSATMRSLNEATIDLPLALTAAEAKEVALRQCFAAWAERVRTERTLAWTHIDLDPGDVVTFGFDDGRLSKERILELGIGDNLELRLLTVVEESSSYTAEALADPGLGYRPPIASPSPISKLILADSPLLSDADDTLRRSSGLYWLMGGVGQPAWQGALLIESTDGAIYAVEGESTSEMAWGIAQTALADVDTPYQTDRESTLTVKMNTGSERLVAVTELEMLNGANRAFLVDPAGTVEVIAFADVEDLGRGSLTLETFLRGLRGTENMTGDHVAGSLFVLIEDDVVQRLLLELAELDALHFYRGVGRGQSVHEVLTNEITPVGRDLMPYCPVQLATNGVSWGSTITLSWLRQTRAGGSDWTDGFADTPLSEDSEEYELEILDGPGGSVLRTATGITSPSFSYTAVMQAADFVSPQTELTFRVYQISAQVGRGFPGEDTADVS
jgi:hypothetical protein